MKEKVGKTLSKAGELFSDYRTYVPGFSGAALAFFLIVLIIPATSIIAMVAHMLKIDLSMLVTILSDYLTKDYAQALIGIIENSHFSLGSITIVILSIYAISRSIGMIYTISKKMFPTKRKKENILQYYIYIFTITLVLLAMIIALISFVALAPVQKAFSNFYGYVVLRFFLFIVILFLFFFVIYMLVPRTRIYYEDARRGAMFTTVGMLLLYIFCATYVANANYGNVYGPLASIIVILFVFNWGSEIFYMGMYVVHLAAEHRQENRIQRVKIDKVNSDGIGIATVFRKPCLIYNAFKGEEVEIYVDKDEGRILQAHVTRVLNRSAVRTHSECGQTDKCRLCRLQYMKYYQQIEFKQKLIINAIKDHSHFPYDDEHVMPVMPANDILHYRQYVAYPIFEYYGKLYVGHTKSANNQYTFMDNCPLQDKAINKVLNTLEDIMNINDCKVYDRKTKKGLRFLAVKKIEEDIHVIFVTGKDGLSKEMIEDIRKIEEVDGLFYSINTSRTPERYEDNLQKVYGEDYLKYHYQGDEYILSAGSYVFLSPEMEDNTIQLVSDMIDPNDRLLSLYCKSGILEMQLQNPKITAVDELACNIEDATNNAKRLGKDNIRFIHNNVEAEIVSQCQKHDYDSVLLHLRSRRITMGMLQTLFQAKSVKNVYVISDEPNDFMLSLKAADFSLKRLDAFNLEICYGIDKEPYTTRVETLMHFTVNHNKKSIL